MGRKVIRDSEAFKLKVVSELESGELSSQAEARRKCGIGGAPTIPRWLRKYGKNHLLAKDRSPHHRQPALPPHPAAMC